MKESGKYHNSNDSSIDPVTGVLKNKFNIKSAEELAITEGDLTTLRYSELLSCPIKPTFDLKHLQAIHKYLFQDLYDWAGQLRKVDLSKNSSMFALSHYIEKLCWRIISEIEIRRLSTGNR